MRRWGLIVAAGLSASGCRYLERLRNDRTTPADTASRPKDRDKDRDRDDTAAEKDRHWLDGPGGRAVGKGAGPADPPDADGSADARGTLTGFVEDPDGNRLQDVFVEVRPTGEAGGGAPRGVQTIRDGYFLIKGLRPNQPYVLSAKTRRDGHDLFGQMYVRTPNPRIRLPLVEGPAPTTLDPPAPGLGRSPLPDPVIPPPALPPTSERPAPAPLSSDAGTGPADRAKAGDGSFSPVAPRPTRPAPPAPTATPASRPDLTTDIPYSPPPPEPPRASPTSGGRTQSRSIRPHTDFTLVEAGSLARSRAFPSGRDGDLVLLDFLTTTCRPCALSVPVLTGLQARYGARGFEVVGVACDDADTPQRRAAAAGYARDHQLNYSLYVEPDAHPGKVQDRFKVESYPALVLLDGAGGVLWKGDPRQADELERVIRDKLGR